MITHFVRAQLAIFIAVSLVAITVLLVVYAQLPTLLGFGQRTLVARFADGAGLYEDARVSYRGVEIGSVRSVDLDGDEVLVTMRVDDDADVPAASSAHVHSVSAIGEQYVDLTADRHAPPFLGDGDEIALNRTTTPPQIGEVLNNADKLLASLPADDLATTLDELAVAFNGTGPQLRRLLDQSALLVDTAEQNYRPTEKLINDLGRLLDTQTTGSTKIRSLVSSLASFTGQVRATDRDIRTLLERGQPFARQVRGTFNDLRPTLPVLLTNLINVEQALVTYNPSLESVLVLYPKVTTTLLSTTLPHAKEGQVGMDLRLGVNAPAPCTNGFLAPSQRRGPSETKELPTPDDLYCKITNSGQNVVRGVRNSPCLEVPGRRAATPADCRAGYRPNRGGNPPFPPGSPGGAVLNGTYDPATGMASLDGHLFTVGAVGQKASGKEDMAWQRLLLAPSGL